MGSKTWVAVGGLAFVTVGAIVVIRLRPTPFDQAANELPAALAQAKSLGLPMVASDLDRKPPVKPEDNMARVIRKASLTMQAESELKANYDKFSGLSGKSDPRAVLKSIDKLNKLTNLAVLAASKPHCDFQYDWDKSLWVNDFNELIEAKMLVKLLQAKAQAEIEIGQIEQGIQDYHRVAQIGTAVGEAPRLTNYLVARVCYNMALRGYEKGVQLWHDDIGKLNQLKKGLHALPTEPSYRNGLRLAFYDSVVLTRNYSSYAEVKALVDPPKPPSFEDIADAFAEGPQRKAPSPLIRSGEPKSKALRALLARPTQYLNAVFEEFRKKPSDRELLAFFRSLEKTSRKHQSPDYLLVSKMIGDHLLYDLQNSTMEAKAKRACLKGLIDVVIFRAKNHRLPVLLAEVGCHEVDHFSGKPLKLLISSNECRVYSIGPDGIDNHGLKQREANGSTSATGYDLPESCTFN